MSKEIYDVLVSPILSEKSVLLKDKENRYSFKINRNANKVDVKNAVETIFNVKVQGVWISNVHGKMHRVGRYSGMRPDWKKAVVRIKSGQKIDFTNLPK